jgi:hypothetical protein
LIRQRQISLDESAKASPFEVTQIGRVHRDCPGYCAPRSAGDGLFREAYCAPRSAGDGLFREALPYPGARCERKGSSMKCLEAAATPTAVATAALLRIPPSRPPKT